MATQGISMNVQDTAQITALVDRGALFVVNHSGGKDSQAMMALVVAAVPAAQILVIHADLGEVEWRGVQEHIRATIGAAPLIVCRSRRTLLEMIDDRGMFPSPEQRQCTSDLKRGPIEREIRRYLKAHPEFGGLVVNCMGLRAQESPGRARKARLKLSERNSKAGREWYDWHAILELELADVWAVIAAAGQTPHWAYAAGMTRLSCCFCIMASPADLRRAAELNPDLYRKYVALERKLGRSMLMPKPGASAFLEDVTGIKAS